MTPARASNRKWLKAGLRGLRHTVRTTLLSIWTKAAATGATLGPRKDTTRMMHRMMYSFSSLSSLSSALGVGRWGDGDGGAMGVVQRSYFEQSAGEGQEALADSKG